MTLAKRTMLGLMQLSLLLLAGACSPDQIPYPYPRPGSYPAPSERASSEAPPVTIWCWAPWPSGIDPPPAFDAVARFKDRQVGSRGLSDHVEPDDVADLLKQYRKALRLPRGTRPVACTWQNHMGNRKNRFPRGGTETANTYWCERTRAFVNAIEQQRLPLPPVWLFDTEMSERLSGPVYDNCVWPLLRKRIGEDAVLGDWKSGETVYMPVLYHPDWQENLERLRKAKEEYPDRELIPWIAAPGTARRGEQRTAQSIAKTIEAAAELGVRRWYLWGDWGHVSLAEARRDWNAIIEVFSATYGDELHEKAP